MRLVITMGRQAALRLLNPFSIALLWLLPGALITGLACNVNVLVRQQPPPTLQISVATATPLPTVTPSGALPTEVAAQPPIDHSVSSLVDEVQSDRLMYTIYTLANMNTRHVLSRRNDPAAGIGAARDWLLAQFQTIRDQHPQRQLQVWTQAFAYTWHDHAITAENIVAVIPGTQVGAGVVVIGAHYDSITTDWDKGEAYAPGANDNGSGIAALLEIAQIMGKSSRQHRATLIFVAFAAEETGKQGSISFVQDYIRAQNIDVRAMINLDMIGSDTGPNGEIDGRTLRLFSADPNDSISRQLARQIALIARTYITDTMVVLQSSEERRGRWGDHQSFSGAGYASVRFIQGLEDVTRQHSPRDTPDGVQPAFLMRNTRLVLAVVKVLADGLPMPQNIDLKMRSGDASTLTLSWSAVPGAVGYLLVLRKQSSLNYDQVLTLGNVDQLTWADIVRYHTLAIAGIDENGQIGILSPELPIARLMD